MASKQGEDYKNVENLKNNDEYNNVVEESWGPDLEVLGGLGVNPSGTWMSLNMDQVFMYTPTGKAQKGEFTSCETYQSPFTSSLTN